MTQTTPLPTDMKFSRPLAHERLPVRLPLALSDGYETSLYYHAPPPGTTPRLPVLYAHGIQSHPGWFVGSADALALAGHPVFQLTRRGSGDNTVARGHAHSAALLLNDVQLACRQVLARTNAPRLHLVGVSWGGKLLACYCIHPKRQVDVASLTLVAPGIVPQVDASVGLKLAIAASLLVRPLARFDIPLNEPELFTDNPDMQQYLRDDPLRLHKATARFLLASRLLDLQLRSAAPGSLLDLQLPGDTPSRRTPTTLLLASRDRIIDNPATTRAVQRLTANQAAVHQLDGCHTLEFEPDPQPFFEILRQSLAE